MDGLDILTNVNCLDTRIGRQRSKRVTAGYLCRQIKSACRPLNAISEEIQILQVC